MTPCHRHLRAVSIRKTVLPGMAIPMLKIRRPNGRLIFNMKSPYVDKTVFILRRGPGWVYSAAPMKPQLFAWPCWLVTVFVVLFQDGVGFVDRVPGLVLGVDLVLQTAMLPQAPSQRGMALPQCHHGARHHNANA